MKSQYARRHITLPIENIFQIGNTFGIVDINYGHWYELPEWFYYSIYFRISNYINNIRVIWCERSINTVYIVDVHPCRENINRYQNINSLAYLSFFSLSTLDTRMVYVE